MIKGVNKRVIEINNPDSIYFEKAIFYLKPNVRELPSEISRREAERYISQLGLEYIPPRKHGTKRRIISAVVFIVFIAAAAVAFL